MTSKRNAELRKREDANYSSHRIDESLFARVVALPGQSSGSHRRVWDTVSPDDLPVTDAERALIDARLADMERNPDAQSPWPEVKARLERLLR